MSSILAGLKERLIDVLLGLWLIAFGLGLVLAMVGWFGMAATYSGVYSASEQSLLSMLTPVTPAH